jgi:hypothetical protein
MKPTNRYIIMNSSLLFITAQIIEMTLHEFGHFIAAMVVHAQQIVIHHNYTTNISDGLLPEKFIWIKAAGPFVSLIVGVLFHGICLKRSNHNAFHLFSAYMSANGYIGFFAYLIIAPLLPMSDTGYICCALGLPVWLIWFIAGAGGASIYFLMNKLIIFFVEMGPKDVLEQPVLREQFVRAVFLYPLGLGMIGTTLLNLPVPVWISLIAPICGNLLFLCGYETAKTKPVLLANTDTEFDRFNRIQIPIIVIFLLVVAVNRMLVQGISIH